MMQIAESAGFCFGVKRGVDMVFDLINSGERVVTLGPIIHNTQLVNKLESKGVRIVQSPSEVKNGEILVIRSHGVAANIYDSINELGISFSDATCPFVSKIHKIAKENSTKDTLVLIAGDPNHPEVIGIMGHCKSKAIAFLTEKELENIASDPENKAYEKIVLVAQTTFNVNLWEKYKKIAKKLYTNLKIFDTICNATQKRQADACEIASKSDLMIIIGDKNSSNTAKLKEVCSEYCNTILIETNKELLDYTHLMKAKKIGITAGASTPADIIQEVINTMSELLEKQTQTENFEELLEQSLNSTEKIFAGRKVKGTVIAVYPNEIQVDVGAKQGGFVSLSELTDDPNLKASDVVKVGEELMLFVMKVNDQEGIINLSKKRCDLDVGFEKIRKAYEQQETLEGVVVETNEKGIVVVSNAIRVFIPGSQVSISRMDDFSSLLKTKVQFKLIDMVESRRRFIGSIKVIAKQQKDEAEKMLWETLSVGQAIKGTVRSITGYGAFVDIGGVDGLVHITELSWRKIKHPSDVVKVGDVIEVYIKELDTEKKKISLGHKKADENPWILAQNNYAVGQNVNVKIVSIAPFGAFAEIVPGVDGLIHISQIANEKVMRVNDKLKVGDQVEAQITEFDAEKQRISLSMRVLLEVPEENDNKELKQDVAALENVEFTTDESEQQAEQVTE